MRNRQRGLRQIYYSLYQSDAPIYDEDGYELSETESTYSEPVAIRVNYGPEKKYIASEAFGRMEEYDLTFSVCDLDCPITVDSRIWVEKDPNQGESHDYIVRRIGTTKNVKLYGLKAVTVS